MNLFTCNHWFLFIRAQVTGIVALIRLEFALLHPIYQFLRNGNLWLTPQKKKKQSSSIKTQHNVLIDSITLTATWCSLLQLCRCYSKQTVRIFFYVFFFHTNFRKFKRMIAYSWKQQRKMNQLLAQWKDIKVSSPRKEILSPH